MIHAQGGHGDVLSWPPFRDSLSSSWKCCQWETLNHQPLWGQSTCKDPSGWRYKGLIIGCVRTTLRGHLHSRPPWSQLRSSGPVIQLDPSLCLILFLPSWFYSVDPKGTPDTHPSTKLHPSLHPREPACNMYQKIFQYWGGFLLKITGYTCIYNSLKPPNKTQNGRNKNLLCECGYLWFKIHNLMLSDQMKLLYVNNKRKLYVEPYETATLSLL